MSDAPPGTSLPGQPRRTPRRWQLGVRGLILLVVVAALGFSIATDRRRIADLSVRIDHLRPMLRTLELDDPTQFAAIKLDEPWAEQDVWDVYLPPGRRYRLALTTRRIDTDSKFPAPLATGSLAPGRHRLSLIETEASGRQTFAIRDGASRVLEAAEDPSWSKDLGGRGGQWLGSEKTTQQPLDRPLQLFRWRNSRHVPNPDGTPSNSFTSSMGPTEGALLWIEALPEGESGPAISPGPSR